MKKLRIVLLFSDPPLPFGAPGARWFHTLYRGLVERGHSVTAFAACASQDEVVRTSDVYPRGDYDIRCYVQPPRRPVLSKIESLCKPHSYHYSRELQRDLLRELSRGFDIVQLEHLWTGWLNLKHIPNSVLNVHFLVGLDEGNDPSSLREKLIKVRTHQAELQILRRYQNISTFSARDSAHVKTINPRSAVYTIPLGVDLSLYPFSAELPPADPPVLGLIGSFDWAPSHVAGIRLLTRLWPEIKRRVPAARLMMVGRSARKCFGAFAGPEVTVEENVPDTIPYFRQLHTLLYAPGRASGMKVKVLEAFGLGTPVVTTSEGVQGMPAEDGVHAGIFEEDSGLIDRTVQLLTDATRRERQRRSARELLERYCGSRAALDQAESIYFDVLNRNPRSQNRV